MSNEQQPKQPVSRKPDGIRLAGVYEILSKSQEPRTVICLEIEWNQHGITKIAFYEPATNLINDCTVQEVADMVEKGILQIKTTQRGRRVFAWGAGISHKPKNYAPAADIIKRLVKRIKKINKTLDIYNHFVISLYNKFRERNNRERTPRMQQRCFRTETSRDT